MADLERQYSGLHTAGSGSPVPHQPGQYLLAYALHLFYEPTAVPLAPSLHGDDTGLDTFWQLGNPLT